MPPLRLTTVLQDALPSVSGPSRALVSALGCYNGDASPAGAMAVLVGMRSRYQLARALRRAGLPPLKQLSSWARLFHWLLEAEGTGASLRHIARDAHVDPATAYRLVRRMSGRSWSDLRRSGLAAALQLFRSRCEVPAPLRGERAARHVRSLPSAVRQEHQRVTASCSASPRHPRGLLTGRVSVPGRPFDVAINAEGMVCVTRTHAAAIECLAQGPLHTVGSVPTGAVPTRVVFNAAGNLAYVTNQFAETVSVIDMRQSRQIAAIPIPGHPMAAILSPDDRTLFVTTNVDRVCAITLPTGRISASLAVPQICTEIALDPSGRRLYVPTWRAGSILEVDARTLQVLRRFGIGGKVQGLALLSDGATLFAANEGGWVDVIDLHSGRRITRLSCGSTAFGVAVSPDDAVVYVSLLLAGLVVIVDSTTLSVRTSLAPGGKPRRISFDPGGRTALVANEEGWVDEVL